MSAPNQAVEVLPQSKAGSLLRTVNTGKRTLAQNPFFDAHLRDKPAVLGRDHGNFFRTGLLAVHAGLGQSFRDANPRDNGEWAVINNPMDAKKRVHRFPVPKGEIPGVGLIRDVPNVVLLIGQGFIGSNGDRRPVFEVAKDSSIRGENTRLVVVNDMSQVLARIHPAKDGWYVIDPITGMPLGEPSSKSDPNALFLTGTSWGHINFVVRSAPYYPRTVFMSLRLTDEMPAIALAENGNGRNHP